MKHTYFLNATKKVLTVLTLSYTIFLPSVTLATEPVLGLTDITESPVQLGTGIFGESKDPIDTTNKKYRTYDSTFFQFNYPKQWQKHQDQTTNLNTTYENTSIVFTTKRIPTNSKQPNGTGISIQRYPITNLSKKITQETVEESTNRLIAELTKEYPNIDISRTPVQQIELGEQKIPAFSVVISGKNGTSTLYTQIIDAQSKKNIYSISLVSTSKRIPLRVKKDFQTILKEIELK